MGCRERVQRPEHGEDEMRRTAGNECVQGDDDDCGRHTRLPVEAEEGAEDEEYGPREDQRRNP